LTRQAFVPFSFSSNPFNWAQFGSIPNPAKAAESQGGPAFEAAAPASRPGKLWNLAFENQRDFSHSVRHDL
jgi:hypothetical protein